jgi:hypothetical protein
MNLKQLTVAKTFRGVDTLLLDVLNEIRRESCSSWVARAALNMNGELVTSRNIHLIFEIVLGHLTTLNKHIKVSALGGLLFLELGVDATRNVEGAHVGGFQAPECDAIVRGGCASQTNFLQLGGSKWRPA